MKAVIVLCLLGFAFVTALECGDGRPGCLLPSELSRPWKNNYDPTKYWVCEVRGEPGVKKNCPGETGFMNFPPQLPNTPRCVGWAIWQWEEPFDPITCGN